MRKNMGTGMKNMEESNLNLGQGGYVQNQGATGKEV